MPAEVKILVDVAWYRIRRLEMANLVAASAIMFTLGLSIAEFAVRFGFGALLNLLVYLNNDYLDRDSDLATGDRDDEKTNFLAAHSAAAVRAQIGLLVLLVGIGWAWGGGLLLVFVAGAGVCWAYSAILKRVGFADVAAMMIWGVAMPAVGVPPEQINGWLLVGQLGLFSAVFETIQVMRDHDEDARLGIRTTAVMLGVPVTKTVARVLMLIAAAYAALVFHPLAGLPVLVAAAISFGENVAGYWNRVRVLLGLSFVIECGLVRWASIW